MQSGKNEMAGFGGSNGSGNGFRSAHFTNHCDIHILAKHRQQSRLKILGINFHFPLVNNGPFFFKNIFNRVFNGDNMLRPGGINEVNERRQSRRLAVPNGTHYQKKALLFFSKSGEQRRQIQFFQCPNFSRYQTQSDTHRPLLKVTVTAEPRFVFITVRKIYFLILQKSFFIF